MDIVEVLKILSRQSGLNIVVGKNVAARVTVFMKNVDFWDALRIILESRDLAYAGTADLVTVMTAQDYERTYGRAFAARTVRWDMDTNTNRRMAYTHYFGKKG